MSRQLRYRVAAVLVGGLLLGAPLLAGGPASAGQLAGGPRLVFGGGGVLGLSCESEPNVESLTVPANSTVTVVNRTGHPARLRLGGADRGMLANGGSTGVVFRGSTTPVTVDPDCLLAGETTPALVTADPTLPVTPPIPELPTLPGLIPDPPGTVPAEDPTTTPDFGSSDATADGVFSASEVPASRPPSVDTGKPGTTKPEKPRPGVVKARPGATTRAVTKPPGRLPQTKPARSTTGAVVDRERLSAVPQTVAPPTKASRAAVALPTKEIAANQRLSSRRSTSPERPTGLLTVVATVCVIGVGAGAIRAFVAERAYRSQIA